MKRGAVQALAALGAVALTAVAAILWPAPPPITHVWLDGEPKGRLEVFAHGGGQAVAPANTLEALRRALADGADVLEVDVQMTADGAAVLHHDDTLDRQTDMEGAIASLPLAIVQKADAGALAMADGTSFAGQGIAIPRLDTALAAFPDARWTVEIKNDTAIAADTICAIIKASQAESRVLVASFHDAAMKRFRAQCPAVATALSPDEIRAFVIAAHLGLSRFVRVGGIALQVPVEAGGFDLTAPRVVNAARARGLRLHYWTINTRPEIEALARAGADGVMTDDVALGLAAPKATAAASAR